MSDSPYTNRELDLRFTDIHEKLDLILAQTTRHNGRMTRVEKILLVFGTVIVVLLIVNGSKFVDFAGALVGI